MNTPDPRFVITFAAPVTFRGVGPFAAVRVELLPIVPSDAAGYRFRPLRDTRPEDSDAPEPVWVEIGGEYFAADATPTEARALAVIEAHLATPQVLPNPIPALQDALLEAYTRVELLNITPAGAIDMAGFVQAGGVKAIAVRSWITAHWAEFRAKQIAINTGETVNPQPSSLWKPYSYAEMAAEYSA